MNANQCEHRKPWGTCKYPGCSSHVYDTGTGEYLGYRESPAETAIREAMTDADVDGYGDEGAGYDMTIFMEGLVRRGWVYQPQDDRGTPTDGRPVRPEAALRMVGRNPTRPPGM